MLGEPFKNKMGGEFGPLTRPKSADDRPFRHVIRKAMQRIAAAGVQPMKAKRRLIHREPACHKVSTPP